MDDVGPSCIRDVLDYALDPNRVLVEQNHPVVQFLRDHPGCSRYDVDKAKRWICVERDVVQAYRANYGPHDVAVSSASSSSCASSEE